MVKHVCDTCPCFTRQFGVKLDYPFSVGDGWTTYTAMGLGICEHKERPRGLMPSYYNTCPDWSGESTTIKDVTPKNRRITKENP